MSITDSALITALRRQADIAASTDRGAVLSEAADRLEALATDGERLDFLEAQCVKLAPDITNNYWYASSDYWLRFYVEDSARQAIDAAMRKENAP